MIINEFAGSGGDAMPWLFRHAGIGPLVGKRTWGGLVGICGFPPLMDGGMVTAPNTAFWNPNGTWDVENHGVEPDVEVENDPQSSARRARPAVGEGGRSSDGGTEEKPAPHAQKARLSELPQRAGSRPKSRQWAVGSRQWEKPMSVLTLAQEPAII